MTVVWRAGTAVPVVPRVTRPRFATAAVLAYVLLWLAEGALRKWVPVTGTVMYVARDGVLVAFVVAQYVAAPKRRSSIVSLLFWGFITVVVVLTAAQIVLQGSPALIAVLGLRNYLAPIAFVYFFWRFWRSEGAVMIKVLLLSVPIELALTAGQVVSPASAFINIDVSGEATGLATALGVVRGSGTFSDAGTLASYATVVFAVCLGLLTDPSSPVRRRWLLVVLSLDVLMMTIAGERTAIFGSAAVLVVWLIREVSRAELRSLVAVGSVLGAGLGIFLLALAVYPTAVASFGQRFVDANSQENSAGRVAGSALGFLLAPLTPLGAGAGARSNVALALGGGQTWIETEQARWVAELGVVGLVLVLLRIAIGVALGARLLTGLTTLAPLTVTMACVLGPQLVAGSISVNPAVQGAAAVTGALFVWSAVRRTPEPPGPPGEESAA